ncbi:MAG: FxLYD domain-containing protein [Clostridia bacterium]|nr:FxLYD domain-containing protein [Clostridia bacterium]
MKRLWTKTLAFLVVALSVVGFSACEEKLALVGEPTMTVVREDDGEYTAIVEGYAKNTFGSLVYRSEATADFYDAKGKTISRNAHLCDSIMQIGKDDVWHFCIIAENLPEEPAKVEVLVYEDW